MGNLIVVILSTTIVFLAMVLQLAVSPRYARKLMEGMLIVSVIGGVLLYGYGYAALIPNPAMATIHSLLAVCGMFVAKNNLSEVAAAPLYQYPAMVFVFWAVHLLALYTTASAAITTVGKEMLKSVARAFSMSGDVAVIFGTSERALSIGRECRREKYAVVFVDEDVDGSTALKISRMRAVLRSDSLALHPDRKLLRSLRLTSGRRKLYLYAIREDEESNKAYALEMKAALEAAHVPPEQTSVVVFGDEEALAPTLQLLEDEQGQVVEYGFGHVSVISSAELIARVMIQKCPPFACLRFDEDGRAEEDFDCLVIGFGKTGQAVLKQLVMNGQFEGSHFHAAVIAPDCLDSSGCIRQMCQGIFQQYDVELMQASGSDLSTFEYIRGRKNSLKYIAVCIGSEKVSSEVTEELMRYLRFLPAQAKVVQCLHNTVMECGTEAGSEKRYRVFQKCNVDSLVMDRMAMELNHSYTGNTALSPWEDWKRCDYFSRMSSRASVDYIPALVFAAHSTPEAVVSEGWHLTEQQTRVLAQSEHLRWCAFHYGMGFQPMSEEEYASRTQRYLDECQRTGQSRLRISKNMEARTHACLVSWEALDALSRRENETTGGHRDYQYEDIKNILAVEKLLKADKAGGRKRARSEA